jgi:hypothetical protein
MITSVETTITCAQMQSPLTGVKASFKVGLK